MEKIKFMDEETGRFLSRIYFSLPDDEGNMWERGEELHQERSYEPEELVEYLREAGFQDIRQYGNRKMRPPKPGEDRIFITARKDPRMTTQV